MDPNTRAELMPSSAELSAQIAGSPRSSGRVVRLLILCGVAALLFLSAAGLLVFRNTRRLLASRDWIEHSQDVLYSIQTVTLQLDRVQNAARLFSLNHDTEQLNSARATAGSLGATLLHLQQLVGDNPSQSAHVLELTKSYGRLERATDRLSATPDGIEDPVLDCRKNISVIQQEERSLLLLRTKDSQSNNTWNLAAWLLLISLSLLIVIVLFGFLVQDAMNRRKFEERLREANSRLATTVGALESKARESSLLAGARDEIALCQSARQAEQCVARFLGQLLPATSGGVCIINNSRHSVEVAATWKDCASLLDGFSVEACCGLRSGRSRWRKPAQSEVHCAHFTGTPPENYICLPLAAQGETMGIIYVECPTPGTASMVDARFAPLQQLIELASVSIANLNLRSRLENQSIRDSLTGMFNRRFMEIALERELHRAMRQQKSLAVLMLDVDHFKQFNDTFGHEAGDEVLRNVADTIHQSIRNEDIACRYGGEELLLIMPEISTDDAVERADHLRQTISEIGLHYRGQSLRQITISVGVAVYPHHADTSEALLRAADRALYDAKHQGRNRVVLTPARIYA